MRNPDRFNVTLGTVLSFALLLAQAPAALAQNKHTLPLFISASHPTLQGLARIINLSERAGEVTIHAIDDTGQRFGPVTLSLEAKATQNFTSDDLRDGNAALSGGVGFGQGNWRLELDTDLDIDPLAYSRPREDAFLTSTHDVVAEGESMRWRVPFFNPGSATRRQSWLRVVNTSGIDTEVTVEGLDDRGAAGTGVVRFDLAADAARMLRVQELEQGSDDSSFEGRLGDGVGKWQLFVSADRPIQVMSLLLSETGHLTNLSTSTIGRDAGPPEIPQPGTRLRDCEGCPDLVVVPAGTYRMGSPASEAERQTWEGPVHGVTITHPFAVGVHEVTRGDFSQFVSETGHSAGDACSTYEDGAWTLRPGRTWRSPGISQTDDHPVVCVSWSDAKAYVAWLGRKTGQAYRLLSESEWEYVARAGTSTARYWGGSEVEQCRYANGRDQAFVRQYPDWVVDGQITVSCDDGHAGTAPVGSYEANGFGLHDVIGNVWEWVEDCWNESYEGAPAHGEAWATGSQHCQWHMRRGGSWTLNPLSLRSAQRNANESDVRGYWGGFRVARTIPP